MLEMGSSGQFLNNLVEEKMAAKTVDEYVESLDGWKADVSLKARRQKLRNLSSGPRQYTR